MSCKNFLKVYKNAGEKMFAKSLCGWLFFKIITINCNDNDNAICFVILGGLLLLGSPWNEISLEVLQWSIYVAAQPFYLD